MATLFVSIIALVLITLATLFANRTALFEQVTSANHHRYSRAFEAAQGGLDYAIAWLGTNGYPNCNPDPAACTYTIATGATGAAWVSDTAGHPPYNEKNTTSIPAQTLGGYTAAITLWRNSASPQLVEIVSTVAIDSSLPNNEAGATVRQVVNVNALMFRAPSLSPFKINGCLDGVTGTPDIYSDPSVKAIESSADVSCLDIGKFNLHGGIAPTGHDFSGSAWDNVFSITKQQMLALANKQPTGAIGGPIYYFDGVVNSAGSNWNPPSSLMGSEQSPVIVIFDNVSGNCPGPTGNTTIYGIVYCNSGLDMNGWGKVTIYGTLASDSAITKYNANTEVHYNAKAANPVNYSIQPVVSRVSGSWRDF